MPNVTISQKEYDNLIKAKLQYETFRSVVQDNPFSPPQNSTSKIVKAFKDTGKYSKQFLVSLQKGLKRSSHFTK